MRILVLLLALAFGVNAYGGYGSQSPAFKSRADFEPKAQTISPVLPPSQEAYFTPPPIPMPDKAQMTAEVAKSASSESSESKESTGCGPSDAIHTTTTESPRQGCGPSAAVEHVHVDAESGAPLEKVLPSQVGYGEPEKPAEQAKPAVAVSEYGNASPAPQPPPAPPVAAGSFSSATKEEVELYGIEAPVSAQTQQQVTPASTTAETSTTGTTASSSSYEQPAKPSQLPVEASTASGYEPSSAPSSSIATTAATTQSTSAAAVGNGYEVESGPIEVPPAVATGPPPHSASYNGDEEETPAQEIARVPDNENLYEKIAEVPSAPTSTAQTSTLATTAATIPYEAPAPSSAPYQPPVPHAQLPSSTASSGGYDLVNEVDAPEHPAETSEPYGQKVEAAHITEESAGSNDYDEAAPSSQQTSSSSSSPSLNIRPIPQTNVVPSAQPYVPQTSVSSGGSYGPSSSYNQGGNTYAQTSNLGSYSVGQHQSFVPAPSYVQPQPFIPQQTSYVQTSSYQASSYSGQQQSNGCCGGNWFSNQGSLCAPVNYNSCQSQQSSGCGQSFGGYGSSCGGGCQSSCTPCTPVSTGCSSQCAPACTPPCPQPAQQCCCPQPAANPFASLCGGRKKRSIQTLLGICGRRRRL